MSNAPASSGRADARLHMREAEFLRLATGTDNENLITALLRGAVIIEGDLRFAQRIQLLLPISAEEGPR